MKLLLVLKSPSNYHGCSPWKALWEDYFTLDKFTPVNMKNCGRRIVRKHRDIKDSDKYITLDILLNFGSLEKMKITSSEPKYCLGRSGKVLNISLGLNTYVR